MKILGASLVFLACSAAWTQAPKTDATGDLVKARVFTAEEGSVRATANGGHSRDIVHGSLATGEAIEIHESVQMPGSKPTPHTIEHSEFIVVREGTLAFEHDGLTEEVGPGGIIYVAYGTMHAVRNVGKTPATYTVIAIGGNQKK